MDGNKDEAVRCIRLAESAIASKNKEKTLKFIKIAKRLDPNIPINHLLTACDDDLDQHYRVCDVSACPKPSDLSNSSRNYTDDHVRLIQEVRRDKNYYAILGVDSNCSAEEIRKAYRKLSLRVHPDKNNAPGADEAFKIVSKAFKCLSQEESRRQYNQNGFVEAQELEQQNNSANVRRRTRRRATRSDFFDDSNSDPDEIFRNFFYGSQGDLFQHQRVYRTRGTAGRQREHTVQGGWSSWMVFIQFLPLLLSLVLLALPSSESYYSLQRTYAYQFQKVTEKHGVEYFVKLADFDEMFTQGSSARDKIENAILRDYKSMLGRYCHMERQRRMWVTDYPTPHCDKLRSFGVA